MKGREGGESTFFLFRGFAKFSRIMLHLSIESLINGLYIRNMLFQCRAIRRGPLPPDLLILSNLDFRFVARNRGLGRHFASQKGRKMSRKTKATFTRWRASPVLREGVPLPSGSYIESRLMISNWRISLSPGSLWIKRPSTDLKEGRGDRTYRLRAQIKRGMN